MNWGIFSDPNISSLVGSDGTVHLAPNQILLISNYNSFNQGANKYGYMMLDFSTPTCPSTIHPGAGTDISGKTTITRTGVIKNRTTGLYYSTTSIVNSSATNLTGNIDFVLNNLRGVVLTNATGMTMSGDQYVRFSTTGLVPGQVLFFVAAFNVGSFTSFNYEYTTYQD